MGLCASAPVSDIDDEQQQQRQQQHQAAQHKRGGGASQQRGGAAPGPRRSIEERARPILGCFDDVKQHFRFERVLGKGQFGVTRLVVDLRTGEQCACKSISKRKLVTAEDMDDVRREIKVMHHLSGHPHVVTFKGAYEDQAYVHIVQELCCGGELFEQLAAKGYYRERDAAHIMRTVLQVVQHCHSMNVVHRDLKPENFLFADERKHVLKAIDFGLSTFFTHVDVLRDLVGSPYYMAPEVLRRSYGKEADVWSCGVIMYILLSGVPPFFGGNAQQIFRAVLHDSLDLASPPWDTVSPQAKDCVRRMLVRDPLKRPDAQTILRHEWLRGASAAGVGASSDAPLQPEILKRMEQFSKMNRFKKEALRVVATHLPPEEIEGIRQMFCDLDSDRSGTISFEELREGLRRKGALVADGELQRIMARIDLDGSHTLDFDEFLTATVFLGKLQRRENLLAAFSHFDVDGSGFISEEELLQALAQEGVSHVAIQGILGDCDRDSDNCIDYGEFCRMMLTDEAQQSSQRRRSSKAGGHRSGHTTGHEHANLRLPGSSPEAGEPGTYHQQQQQRAGSRTLRVMHGVKSGAWGMSSQTMHGASSFGEEE